MSRGSRFLLFLHNNYQVSLIDFSTLCFQDDFMALEIINGKVVLKADFGSGTSSISNSKWVSDNEWHEVIVER